MIDALRMNRSKYIVLFSGCINSNSSSYTLNDTESFVSLYLQGFSSNYQNDICDAIVLELSEVV